MLRGPVLPNCKNLKADPEPEYMRRTRQTGSEIFACPLSVYGAFAVCPSDKKYFTAFASPPQFRQYVRFHFLPQKEHSVWKQHCAHAYPFSSWDPRFNFSLNLQPLHRPRPCQKPYIKWLMEYLPSAAEPLYHPLCFSFPSVLPPRYHL